MWGRRLRFLLCAAICGCNTFNDDVIANRRPVTCSYYRPTPISAQAAGYQQAGGTASSGMRIPGGEVVQLPAVDVDGPLSRPGASAGQSGISRQSRTTASATPNPYPIASTKTGAANAEVIPVPVDPEVVEATLVSAPSNAGATTTSSASDLEKATYRDKGAGSAAVPPAIAVDPAEAGRAPAIRLVDSKRFTLSFDPKDAAGSQVEVWGTLDGRTWKKVPALLQPPNSLLVEVRDEGVYGFILTAKSGSTSRPPQAGDTPQVWISVDVSKPAVELQGVELSLTSRVLGLVVRWKATDRNFGPRPITIAYAEHRDGPWVPLGAGVENTGRFECPIPRGLPRSVLLRVEATDLMGNVASAQTSTPIRLESAVGTAVPESVSSARPTPALPPAPTPTPTPAPEPPRPPRQIQLVRPALGPDAEGFFPFGDGQRPRMSNPGPDLGTPK
jgi:hypothetical protein